MPYPQPAPFGVVNHSSAEMVGNKMPGESKLDSLATLLEKLKISNETSQKELQVRAI